jgi:mannose-6-phosphate isomerase-like protein (cupin superfamily)
MTPTPINLIQKLSQFVDRWSPKIIAAYEEHHFKLAKLQGDFVWHSHPDSDEVFLVLHGRLRIDFRDGDVTLEQGEMLVVPKGVEHKPFAESECHVLLLDRAGVVNTGDAPQSKLTASNRDWI